MSVIGIESRGKTERKFRRPRMIITNIVEYSLQYLYHIVLKFACKTIGSYVVVKYRLM